VRKKEKKKKKRKKSVGVLSVFFFRSIMPFFTVTNQGLVSFKPCVIIQDPLHSLA
jgi:hypothetical protein